MTNSSFAEDQHTSWNFFDSAVVELIRLMEPSHIIDIGAGGGKYAKLVQRAGLLSKPHIIAVEPVDAAAQRLRDAGLYDEVHVADTEILFRNPRTSTDLLVMGDVLEHLRASEGLDLLQYMTYRSAYILLLVPDSMPMFSSSNFYGCHNSIWRPQCFQWHDLWAFGQWGQLQLFLLRGYLGRERRSLRDIVSSFNALACPIEVDDPSTPTLQLTLHESFEKSLSEDGEIQTYRAQ